MGKMIFPFFSVCKHHFYLWVCFGGGVFVSFLWRAEIHVRWHLLPPHFLIHSLCMGLTLPDKTSCLANRSGPPASLPSTRIELLCWAFYSGTRHLSSGLWLAWKSLTELSPLINPAPSIFFLLRSRLLVGEWTQIPGCVPFRGFPWPAAPTCNPTELRKLSNLLVSAAYLSKIFLLVA